MTEVTVTDTGVILIPLGIVGESDDDVDSIVLTEEIYPLCGNTVQTTAEIQGSVVTVQPNTYTQRVFYDQ